MIGAAGVFIADVRSATVTGTGLGSYGIDGVKVHYLTPGDLAQIDANGNLTVTLAPSKPLLPSLAGQPAVTQNRIQDYGSSNFLNLAKALGVAGAQPDSAAPRAAQTAQETPRMHRFMPLR